MYENKSVTTALFSKVISPFCCKGTWIVLCVCSYTSFDPEDNLIKLIYIFFLFHCTNEGVSSGTCQVLRTEPRSQPFSHVSYPIVQCLKINTGVPRDHLHLMKRHMSKCENNYINVIPGRALSSDWGNKKVWLSKIKRRQFLKSYLHWSFISLFLFIRIRKGYIVFKNIKRLSPLQLSFHYIF